jgi:hypothetical protein
MKLRILFLFGFIVAFISYMNTTLAKPLNRVKSSYYEDLRELALRSCLDINYTKLGAYKISDLNDYSFWTYSVASNEGQTSPDGDLARHAFVEKHAGNFYKESLALKAEGQKPPFTAIFARCMGFYKSDKLKKFLKQTPL